MKHLLTIAAVVCAFALHAATYQLQNGLNDINAGGGEIVGIECMTVGASQAVTASVVTAVSEYTNAYKTVVTPHARYDFTITNYDGNAAIKTNVLDRFSYSDWVRAGTNLIISTIKTSTTNISTQVSDGKRLKATYTKETAIGNGTASSHYLKITPESTQNFFGGKIKLSCGDGDNCIILIK